jgi:hypothetical protein
VSVSIDQMQTKKIDPSNFLFLSLKVHDMRVFKDEQNFQVFFTLRKYFFPIQCVSIFSLEEISENIENIRKIHGLH